MEKEKFHYNEKGQAMPNNVIPIGKEAFCKEEGTTLHWLGGAGVMLNSRGTVLMIDPVLEGFDMPLLIDMPVLPEQVPSLDALLVTHIDNDHFSKDTCRDLQSVCRAYHAPNYVAKEMEKIGISGNGHEIGDVFQVGDVSVTLTPALHNWQNGFPDFSYREWKKEDYCGYWLETPEGTIWLPGDSKLLPEHLKMPKPDVILFDFSDSEWHITLEGAIQLANAYPEAALICIHWGSVDAPEMTPFNGDPAALLGRIQNPERIFVLQPGEAYRM